MGHAGGMYDIYILDVRIHSWWRYIFFFPFGRSDSDLYWPLVYAAIVSGGKGTAQDKIQALKEAGVTVVESPAKLGTAMLDVFKQRGLVN